MIAAFLNCLKIPELRQRIVFTLSLLFVARIGCNIPLPGIDPTTLKSFFENQKMLGGGQLVGLYNLFTGGAFLKGAIFGLGIMPYISASIIFQLLGAMLPSLAKLQQEGEFGRQRLMQYTRYLTLIICFIQGWLLMMAFTNYPDKLFPGFDVNTYGPIALYGGFSFLLVSTLLLTTGTLILTWLGEQITQRGVGNGISLLITVGILSGLPQSVYLFGSLFTKPLGLEDGTRFGLLQGVLMIVLLFTVVAAMIAVTQAQRKIVVQYAKRVVGRKMYGGQSSFLPLKVNYAGVMPVIFASALIMFPQQLLAYLGAAFDVSVFQKWSMILMQGSGLYYTVYGLLILGFSYFWVSIMFKPLQVADDLKKNGGYIPGVRPGDGTAQFLDFVMTRLTLAGAIFLTVIALFPDLLYFLYKIPYKVALFFGGTGTLITVGVLLDTIKQLETYLLQRNYDGFLAKGKMKGRFTFMSQMQRLADTEDRSLRLLWISVLVLFIMGLLAWILNTTLL
ncbi:MAG: preprotein translocase subunit SecY [Puniceicoccales bacterium]|jgi:preprotein translocase subunit SecY|nr:preprotein translocase subunit SecY [Puniceicoccales bacterium]